MSKYFQRSDVLMSEGVLKDGVDDKNQTNTVQRLIELVNQFYNSYRPAGEPVL